MTIAVSSSAKSATGPREEPCGSPAAIPLHRAPVLLRLPALSPTSAPPAPVPAIGGESSAEAPPPKAPPPKNEAPANERSPRSSPSAARESRRERPSRQSRSDASKPKTPLSQWILGGCMLAAGIIGFFVLSGDFGATTDAPPADGWSDQASAKEPPSDDFAQPQFANVPAVAERHESTSTPPPGRTWANPAEGGIVQTPTPQADAPMPAWNGGSGYATTEASSANEIATPYPATTANEFASQAPTEEKQPAGVSLTPPQNEPAPAPSISVTPQSAAIAAPSEAATYNYPNTGTAGLNPPAPPPSIPTTSNYPTTGYTDSFAPGGASGYGPAAYTGMRDNGAAAPGAGVQGAYPGNVSPPAMSPRYERIR